MQMSQSGEGAQAPSAQGRDSHARAPAAPCEHTCAKPTHAVCTREHICANPIHGPTQTHEHSNHTHAHRPRPLPHSRCAPAPCSSHPVVGTLQEPGSFRDAGHHAHSPVSPAPASPLPLREAASQPHRPRRGPHWPPTALTQGPADSDEAWVWEVRPWHSGQGLGLGARPRGAKPHLRLVSMTRI